MKRVAVVALALSVMPWSFAWAQDNAASGGAARVENGAGAASNKGGMPAAAAGTNNPASSSADAAPKSAASSAPSSSSPASSSSERVPDLAFGAFQRGFYLTAFDYATKRVVAEQDPVSMTLLAELYANGLGVPADRTKAIQWYGEAARRGEKNAIFSYGMAKLVGDVIPKDIEGGMLLLNRAAEMKVPEASYNLGIIALNPGKDAQPDYATALRRFQEAADSGSGDALYSLGILTKEGKGVSPDPKKAAEFFLAAANSGNVNGMVEYAIAIFNGDGVVRDEEMAGIWLERAAERGNPIARNRLAHMYASGIGVAPNPVLACMWNILARAGGLNDKKLDQFMQKQPPEIRQAALQAVRQRGF